MRVTVLSFLLFLLLSAPGIEASGVDSRRYLLDLTEGDAVRGRVRWSPARAMELTLEGLGFEGDLRTSWDGWVQVVEPIAVGMPRWAPARVRVVVRIDRDRVRGEIDGRPDLAPETVYARYSADGVRWSTWQHVPEATGPLAERWTHIGDLAVPRSEREPFERMLYRDAREPTRGIDAEATLLGLLEEDPRYLERGIPLIGYVQLMHESSYHGGQRFRRIEASLSWVVPGPVTPGAARGLRWRYRDSCRVDESGRLRVPAGASAYELDLSGTAVTDGGLAALAGLPGLRRLDLSGSGVGDGALEHVAGLRLLTVISLRGTGVTDEEGLRRLHGLILLREIDLRGCAVTERGIESLRAAIEAGGRWKPTVLRSESGRGRERAGCARLPRSGPGYG